jgi:hypothetical protein
MQESGTHPIISAKGIHLGQEVRDRAGIPDVPERAQVRFKIIRVDKLD